jgi:DNA-binding CsgD family transcriptional regulator
MTPVDVRGEEFLTARLHRAMALAVNSREASALDPEWADFFRRLGKVEFTAGQGLERLQRAYQAGGRGALRRLTAFSQGHDVSAVVVSACAEAIFSVVEEISALSSEGYAAAQAETGSDRVHSRKRLLSHILTGMPYTVAELAREAGWPLPKDVILVAMETIDRQQVSDDLGLPEDVLVDLEGPEPYILVPAELMGTLPDVDRRLAVGPAVPLGEAAVSLSWARQTLELVRRGALPDARRTHWNDHLATLMLLTNEFLLEELGSRSLAPLAALSAKQQTKMAETLLAWLTTRGGAPTIATMLDVHPQTVRHHLRQLKKLFGDRLDDPDERFRLEIALRAHQLTQHLAAQRPRF